MPYLDREAAPLSINNYGGWAFPFINNPGLDPPLPTMNLIRAMTCVFTRPKKARAIRSQVRHNNVRGLSYCRN